MVENNQAKNLNTNNAYAQEVILRGIYGLRKSTPTTAVRMLPNTNSLNLEIKIRNRDASIPKENTEGPNH